MGDGRRRTAVHAYFCSLSDFLHLPRLPITKEGSYNIGVMYDPHCNLIWAVNTDSPVFVMTFDVKIARLATAR